MEVWGYTGKVGKRTTCELVVIDGATFVPCRRCGNICRNKVGGIICGKFDWPVDMEKGGCTYGAFRAVCGKKMAD